MIANIDAQNDMYEGAGAPWRRAGTKATRAWMLVLAVATFVFGCRTGQPFRSLHLDSDLRPGDLSYYQDRARNMVVSQPQDEMGNTHLVIEDGFDAFPFVVLPLVWGQRRTFADFDESSSSYYLSVAHSSGVLLAIFLAHVTAKFDPEGVNLSGRRGRGILFGLCSYGLGHEVVADNTRVPTSDFSILWGLFSTARTPYGRQWTVFWFPLIGEDTSQKDQSPSEETG